MKNIYIKLFPNKIYKIIILIVQLISDKIIEYSFIRISSNEN